MEVIIGATVGVVLLIVLIVYGIVKLFNRGNEVIVVTQRSPTQLMENIKTAFPAEIPQTRMNALAAEVARLRARPNIVTTHGKPYIVVEQSRKDRKSRHRK